MERVTVGRILARLQRLASASSDGTVKIWDAETGTCLQTLNGDRIRSRQSSSSRPTHGSWRRLQRIARSRSGMQRRASVRRRSRAMGHRSAPWCSRMTHGSWRQLQTIAQSRSGMRDGQVSADARGSWDSGHFGGLLA